MSTSVRRQGPRQRWLQAALSISAILGSAFLVVPELSMEAQPSKVDVSSMPDWQVAAGKRLEFEVATVKPNLKGEEEKVNFTLGPGDAYAKTGGMFIASGITLLDTIRFAYKLTDGQAQILETSAPKWLTEKRFDIQAKASNPDVTKDEMRLMVQSLLVERFKLVVHSETRQLPVLALTLAKPGKLGPLIKLHPADDQTCSNIALPAPRKPEQDSGAATPTVCGALVSSGVPAEPSHVRLVGRKIPIALLAAHLGQMGQFDRPVLDDTGLKGYFDLVLEWGSDPVPGPTAPPTDPGADENTNGTNLQEALLDQLGFKLKRQKGQVGVLLVDSIEQEPTAN